MVDTNDFHIFVHVMAAKVRFYLLQHTKRLKTNNRGSDVCVCVELRCYVNAVYVWNTVQILPFQMSVQMNVQLHADTTTNG